MIKISIITVNFNNLSGLQKTMQSVFCQKYTNLEYIIIDGGSTDGSKDFIMSHQDKLSYWCSEKDKGIYDGMNKGIAKVTGDYVLFLNSGDYFCSPLILNEVFNNNPNDDLLIGRQCYYNRKGKKSIAWSIQAKDINERFFWSNTLPHQSTFIKTTLLNKIGGYNLNYQICADWVFWYEAIVEHKCTYSCIKNAVSYMEDWGISSNMEKCRADMAKFLIKHHPTMTIEDWFEINIQFSEALSFRRAYSSRISRLLMKIAIRLNKK